MSINDMLQLISKEHCNGTFEKVHAEILHLHMHKANEHEANIFYNIITPFN